jgi:hypothetical protein
MRLCTCLPHLHRRRLVDQRRHHRRCRHRQTRTVYRHLLCCPLRLRRQSQATRQHDQTPKGAVRMIKYIFPEPVFLDLCDDQGQLVGKNPQEIMQHLQDSFCDDEEAEEEILKQYKIMNVQYDPSALVYKSILKRYKTPAPSSSLSTKPSTTRY